MGHVLKISSVHIFLNGMVMVFDEHGQQMPEYQGRWLEMRDEITRDAPLSVIEAMLDRGFSILPDAEESHPMSVLPLQRAGEVVNCLRCGQPCRVAPVKDTKARPFQAADGDGQCPACIVTDLLKGETFAFAIASMAEGTDIKEALRAPHIQEQFAQLLRVGNSQLGADEIDWEAVIERWDLPLVQPKKGRRRK